jgi:NADH:ubiquinone oxidoreductase subunit 6 (subunit J)
VLPFEIVSILLLTAMLGAIVIARDKVKGASS